MNVQNKLGITSLHLAVGSDHGAVVKVLLGTGANPYIETRQGQLPIQFIE